MFEEFSSGYYFGRLYIEPYDGEQAVMHRVDHEQVNEQLYARGNASDLPLVIKLGATHIPVHAADNVPGQTLGLPEFALEAAGIDNPPTFKEVLLAKADRAAQLLGVVKGRSFGRQPELPSNPTQSGDNFGSDETESGDDTTNTGF